MICDRMHPTLSERRCQLQHGHDGVHEWMGAGYPRDWSRWSDGGPRVGSPAFAHDASLPTVMLEISWPAAC